MARYEHLPIYKAALDAAVHFEQVVAGFSRYHKYTPGTELRRTSREVVLGIIRANSARERLPQLLGVAARTFWESDQATPGGRSSGSFGAGG